MDLTEAKHYVYEKISSEGFIFPEKGTWFTPEGKEAVWVFDLKALLLEEKFLRAVCSIFWSIYDRTKPIQICGLESASIPLVTALVLSGEKANGIYIRKSKKKKYDLRQIEGKLTDAPIVIVDDVVNFCTSLEKQITVLQKKHYDVHGFFACVHLRPLENYVYLGLHHGIKYDFLFSFQEFSTKYNVTQNVPLTLEVIWHQEATESRDFNVVRRSQMCAGNGIIFCNGDDGYVYAYGSKRGDVHWRQQIQKYVPPTLNQPGLLLSGEELVVAAENGTVAVLEVGSGSVRRRHSVADHLYGDVVQGLFDDQVVLTGKQGGEFTVIIFDHKRNKKIFEYKSSGRLYASVANTFGLILISNYAGVVTAHSVHTGRLVWQFNTDSALHDSVSVDSSSGSCLIISENGTLYQNKLSDGRLLRSRTVSDEPFFYARPTITDDAIILTALHRTVYALDKKSWEQRWEYNTSGRIFSRPVCHNGQVWFGNNEGVLYAVNERDGTLVSKTVLGDRIMSETIFRDDEVFISALGGDVWKLSLKEKSPT